MDKQKRALNVLKFLKENKDLFNLSGLEKRSGVAPTTLSKVVSGERIGTDTHMLFVYHELKKVRKQLNVLEAIIGE